MSETMPQSIKECFQLLSAAENVSVPLRMRHLPRRERDERIAQALQRVGLANRAAHRPYELSGCLICKFGTKHPLRNDFTNKLSAY